MAMCPHLLAVAGEVTVDMFPGLIWVPSLAPPQLGCSAHLEGAVHSGSRVVAGEELDNLEERVSRAPDVQMGAHTYS